MKKFCFIALMAVATTSFVAVNADLNSKTKYVVEEEALTNFTADTKLAETGVLSTAVTNLYEDVIEPFFTGVPSYSPVTKVDYKKYNYEGYKGIVKDKYSLDNDYIAYASDVNSYLNHPATCNGMLNDGYELMLDGTVYTMTEGAHQTVLGARYESVTYADVTTKTALDTGGTLRKGGHGLKITLDMPGELTVYGLSNSNNKNRKLAYYDCNNDEYVVVEDSVLYGAEKYTALVREGRYVDVSTTIMLSAGTYYIGSKDGGALILETSFNPVKNADAMFTEVDRPYYKETLGSLNKVYFVAELNNIDELTEDAKCIATVTVIKEDGTQQSLKKEVGFYTFLVKAGQEIIKDGKTLFYAKENTYYVSYTVGINKEKYGGGKVSCTFDVTIGDYKVTTTQSDTITK